MDSISQEAFVKWYTNKYTDSDRGSVRHRASQEVWAYLHPILVERTRRLNRIERENRRLRQMGSTHEVL
jgi:hypothetical protein